MAFEFGDVVRLKSFEEAKKLLPKEFYEAGEHDWGISDHDSVFGIDEEFWNLMRENPHSIEKVIHRSPDDNKDDEFGDPEHTQCLLCFVDTHVAFPAEACELMETSKDFDIKEGSKVFLRPYDELAKEIPGAIIYGKVAGIPEFFYNLFRDVPQTVVKVQNLDFLCGPVDGNTKGYVVIENCPLFWPIEAFTLVSEEDNNES